MGSYVAHLVHGISQRNTCERHAMALRNTIQNSRHLFLAPRGQMAHHKPSTFLFRTRSLEAASTKDPKRQDRHALGLAHGDNLALQVTLLRRIAALVDGERAQAVLACVGVAFDNEPGRRVTYAQVENFALRHEVVEGLHQLGDGCGVVVYVDVILFC